MEYRNDTGDPIIYDGRDRPKRPLPVNSRRQAALHHFGFNELKQIGPWKTVEEQKKVVTHKGKTFAVIHSLSLLLPLAGAIALITLNARRTPLGHVDMAAIASVQFVAKFLEILMQVALAKIALAVVRHQLLGPEPLPLGGIFAPYRSLDVAYLCSPALWGALTSPSFHGRRKAWFILLVPSIIVLGAVIGPCAAILMVPRQITFISNRGLYMLNDTESTFPTQIQVTSNGSLPLELEFRNFQRNLVEGSSTIFSVSGMSVITSNGSGGRALRISVENHNHMQRATLPTRMVASFLVEQDFNSLTDYASTEAYQPDVQIDCVSLNVEDITDLNNTFVNFGPEKEDLNNLIPFSRLLSNVSNLDNDTSYMSSTYPITEVYPGNNSAYSYTYSILAQEAPDEMLEYSALVVLASLNNPRAQADSQRAQNKACTVSAVWSLYRTNNTISRTADSTKITRPSIDDRTILVPPDWIMRMADIYMTETDYPYFSGYMAPLLAYSLSNDSPLLPELADQDTLFFTPTDDGTTSFKASDHTWTRQQFQSIKDYINWSNAFPTFTHIDVYSLGDWTDPASLVKLDVQTYRSEYGYDSKGVPVRIALTIFCLFVLLELCYIGYSIITGRSATSWDSVADLILLALNSRRPPAELGPTSVGIDALATFREPVNIRVNDQDHLELIFDRDSSAQGTMHRAPSNTAF